MKAKYKVRTKICTFCRKVFTKRMPEKRMFCSRKCTFKYFVGEKAHAWKGGKTKCFDCGKRTRSTISKRCLQCSKAFHVGENAAHYKGKNNRVQDGRYIRLINPDGSYQYEHRLLIEKKLKRKLNKSEHVHHINGNGYDNNLKNLEVLDKVTHGKISAHSRWNNTEQYESLEIEA